MTDKTIHEQRQELFNKAYLGLACQGFERSFDTEANCCMYRDENGRKCAVGQVIDDITARNFELRSVTPELLSQASIDPRHIHFLTILQDDHDCNKNPTRMKGALENTAKEFNLTIPEIPQNG